MLQIRRLSLAASQSFRVALLDRSVVQIEGPDSSKFLQGFTTNDMRRFEDESHKSIYTLMLNATGRVLFDAFIYRARATDSFYLDCDSNLVETLLRHLNSFKLRSKFTLANKSSELEAWSFVNQEPDAKTVIAGGRDPRFLQQSSDSFNNVHRVLVARSAEGSRRESGEYQNWRFSHGIPEGRYDFPIGNCLPIESNIDLLNGVVFNKGCYLGQELTARTHFTGVVRKRLMPISSQDSSDLTNIPAGAEIVNSSGKSLGKLRSVNGTQGLALIRLDAVIGVPQPEVGQIMVTDNNSVKVNIHVPEWWPLTLPGFSPLKSSTVFD